MIDKYLALIPAYMDKSKQGNYIRVEDMILLLEGMKGNHNGTNLEMIAWSLKNKVINEILSKITAKE